MKLAFTPEPIIAEQLTELARITQRPIGDLINDILHSPLDQMIDNSDTGYIGAVLVEGVEYPDHATAAAVAENINAINRATVRESTHGQFHVNSAWAGDDNVVHFTKTKLVKASDLEGAGI
jgi:hypothetical protein